MIDNSQCFSPLLEAIMFIKIQLNKEYCVCFIFENLFKSLASKRDCLLRDCLLIYLKSNKVIFLISRFKILGIAWALHSDVGSKRESAMNEEIKHYSHENL